MRINLLDVPVFYINLAKDISKKEYLESKLSVLGFKNINRINAVEDKENPRRGLSKSQLIALSTIKPPFIVLEDDCDPKYFRSEIKVPDDADAVYLGNSQWAMMQSYSGFYLKYKTVEGMEDVLRIYNMLSAHAILYLTDDYVRVCQRTTRYCAETYPMPMDVPFAMIQRFFNVYAIDKPLFMQKEHEGQMSAASMFTNRKLTEYERYGSPDARPDIRTGIFYKDEII